MPHQVRTTHPFSGLACVLALCVGASACSPELYPPFDPTAPGFQFTQTFGQLIYRDGGLRPAEFVILKVPTGTLIRTIATGTVSYESDFRGLGPSLVLAPKSYLLSDTDFDALEELPRPAALRIIFANLIPSDVESAIKDRYAALNNSNPTLAAQRFMTGAATNRRIDVAASATIATNTALGKAKDDSLFVVAIVGEPNAVEEFVNPLPYLMAALTPAQASVIDNTSPTIGDMALLASDDPTMLNPMTYEMPAAVTDLASPNVLFGHLAIEVKLDDHIGGGPAVGIYELAYQISAVTRNAGGTVLTRSVQSAGRFLSNRIDPANAPAYTGLYNSPRSSAATRSFWYRLHFDATSPVPATIEPRNYLSVSNARSLDISAWTAGEYEIQLSVRDLQRPPATPTIRTVFARIDNSPGAVAAAQWKLRAAFGTGTPVETDRNGGLAFLIVPSATPTPFNVTVDLVNAPAVTAPAEYKMTVASNSVTPGAASVFTSPQTVAMPAPGVHDVIVWLDVNGDGIRQPVESWRRIAVMTYQLNVAILGSRRHLANPYTAITTADLIPKGDGLKLEVGATFQLGHEALATYRWEVTNSTVPGTETPVGKIWEKDPLLAGGTYTAKAFVDLFGLTFEAAPWTQTVVDATIAPLGSICAPHTADVTITTHPSAFPSGSTLEMAIERAGAPGDGDAVFSPAGNSLSAMAGSGSLTIEGKLPSTSMDNLDLVARFDGQEVAREKFAVCKVDYLDATRSVTDSLRVSRWDSAYRAPPSLTVFNRIETDSNLVDRDERRFFIRLTNANANLDPAAIETVSVALGSLFGGGGENDDYTTVDLMETGVSTGIFESRSQLLMSPDLPAADSPDDDYAVHDGVAGTIIDDVRGDRTHRTTARGSLAVRYAPVGMPAVEDTLAVCGGSPVRRKTVVVRVIVFNEPFTDADGSGGFTAGDPFLDLTLDGAWGPVASGATVTNEIERAKVAWAQACISVDLEPGSPRFQAAPLVAGVDILLDGTVDVPGVDQAPVIAAFAPAATFDVPVIFFGPPLAIGIAAGLTLGPFDAIPALGELTFAFIDAFQDARVKTTAHELGHVLDNRGDAAQRVTIFYPFAVAPPFDDAVTNQRRISSATEIRARTRRTAGALGDVGNRMLKDY